MCCGNLVICMLLHNWKSLSDILELCINSTPLEAHPVLNAFTQLNTQMVKDGAEKKRGRRCFSGLN